MKQHGIDLAGIQLNDKAPFGIVGDDGKRWTIKPVLPLVTVTRKRTRQEREFYIDKRNRCFSPSHFSVYRKQLCTRIAMEVLGVSESRELCRDKADRIFNLVAIQKRVLTEPELDMPAVRADLCKLGVKIPLREAGRLVPKRLRGNSG